MDCFKKALRRRQCNKSSRSEKGSYPGGTNASPFFHPPSSFAPQVSVDNAFIFPTSDAPPTYPGPDPSFQDPGFDAYGNTYTTFGGASSKASAGGRLTAEDDLYVLLGTFDTVLLIDDSGSMTIRNAQGVSRWEETRLALEQLLPIILDHDKDGIDIYFINHRSPSTEQTNRDPKTASGGFYNVKSIEKVREIFSRARPSDQSTPTGTRLQSIFRAYLKELRRAEDIDEVTPMNVICITDGRPDNGQDVAEKIVEMAWSVDKLDARVQQVGVQFFQVGNDPKATAGLRELDDGLAEKHDVRDMVDTCKWEVGTRSLTAMGILKIVLGAVSRKIDADEMMGRRSLESRR